jgi:CelD/BcsL family acetyltransferase involved in cellulose biosynthesis
MTAVALPRLDAARLPDARAARAADLEPALPRNGTAAQPLELALITRRDQFDALEAEWNALYERAGRSAQLFLSFNWLWHWCNHYLDGAALAVVTGRRDGRLVLVWPLVRTRTCGQTVLEWMGDPMSQYGDVLLDQCADSQDVLRSAWTFLKSRSGADVVRLRKVRADSAIAPLLHEIGGLRTETAVAPCLDLASARDYAEYEKRYSSSSRKKRRHHLRRLADLGAVTFEELTGGPAARALVEAAVPMKRKWLASRGLVSRAYADDRITRFFGDVAEAATKPAGCLVSVLKVDGQPAAMGIALRGKDRIGLHILVFDIELERASVGTLLIEHIIRAAADGGVACYDLLSPGDAYKLAWADASIAVDDWAVPLTITGRAFARLYLAGLRERLKSAVRRLPAPVRRVLSAGLSPAIKRA